MDALIQLIEHYGLLVVFLAVLIDQGGVPLPAYPPILVASALAVRDHEPLWPIVLVATVAALLADWLWYLGGRRYGSRLVRWMCRLSLSPDSCVGTTNDIYSRWGEHSLIVAKFIPGFAAIATTVAGQTGTRTLRFLVFDGLGALIWATVAVALGAIFHSALNDVIAQLEAYGSAGLIVVLALVAIFVAWKVWKRQAFLRAIRMARISAHDLHALFERGEAPLVLDVRTAAQREASGWIPGALFVAEPASLDVADRHEVVVYCDCPNEASAARVALLLKAKGYRHVRPLAGGLEAWAALGLPLDRPDGIAGAPWA